MIYRDEAAEAQADGGNVSEPFRTFMERNGSALRAGAALQPSSTATSVRADGVGGFAVTDDAERRLLEAKLAELP